MNEFMLPSSFSLLLLELLLLLIPLQVANDIHGNSCCEVCLLLTFLLKIDIHVLLEFYNSLNKPIS